MSQGPQCKLCQRRFTMPHPARTDVQANTATPILLVCGHTFCQKCLLQLYSNKKGIVCPTCKICTKCPQDKIKNHGLLPNMCVLGYLALKDMTILRKLTALAESTTKATLLKNDCFKQNCSECVKFPATTTCVQCGVNVCSDCFDAIHKNSRVLRRHQAIPLFRGNRDLSALDCVLHHSLTEYYCADDNILVCRDCIDNEHLNHKIIPLHEKCDAMKDDIMQAIDNAAPIIPALKKHILHIEDEIKQVESEANQKATKILQYFVDVTGKIQSSFLSLLNDLENLSCAHVRHLLTLRNAAVSKLGYFQDVWDRAALIINPTKATESIPIDPVGTLKILNQALECPCELQKVITKLDCDLDEEIDLENVDYPDERFSLNIDDELMDSVMHWATMENTNRFKYTVKKVDKQQLLANMAKAKSELDSELESAEDSDSASQVSNSTCAKWRLLQVPPAKNQELVYVTFVTSPDDFFIQRHSDKYQIKLIQQELKAFDCRRSCQEELVTCVQLRDLCVACSPNRKWGRAKVINLFKSDESDDILDDTTAGINDEVEISFIDYGKCIRTKVSCLRNLPYKLQRIPPLAFHCSLFGITPSNKNKCWSQQAISMFSKIVTNRPILMTTVSREAGRRCVDLHKPALDEIDDDVPISVRDAMIFLNLAQFSAKEQSLVEALPAKQLNKQRKYFRPSRIPPRTYADVVLCHFQSIQKFFVQQLDSNASYLEALTEKIQMFVKSKGKGRFDPTSSFCIFQPAVGMPCIAKYLCCNMWYRAKIIEVTEGKEEIKVVYVDYGNEAIITLRDVIKIPDEFMKLPFQGIECELTNIQPPSGDVGWQSHSLERFYELAGDDKELRMNIRTFKDDVYSVELFDWMDAERSADNMLSINERLVHEGLATGLTVHKVVSKVPIENLKKDTSEENIELEETQNCDVASSTVEEGGASDAITNQNEAQMVTVIYSESPASFYVQNKDQWHNGNVLTRELHRYMNETEIQDDAKEWAEDDLCAINSSLERRWCRGRVCEVVRHSDDAPMYNVHLLDFGPTVMATSSLLRTLPSKFIDIPAHVTRCILAEVQPAGGSKWTKMALEIFKELTDKKECKMEMESVTLPEFGALPVKLFLPEDVDVGREMILQGVALPVLRLGNFGDKLLDCDPSEPLSRIQLQFELSEVAYQRTVNIPTRKSDVSLSNSNVATSLTSNDDVISDTNSRDPQDCVVEQDKIVELPTDNYTVVVEETEDCFNDKFTINTKDSDSESNTQESTSHDSPPGNRVNEAVSMAKSDDEFIVNQDTDSSNEFFSNRETFAKIPSPANPLPGSFFKCTVSHIEKYNILCLQRPPLEDIFPDGTSFTLNIPLLKHFEYGRPCLACFDEDEEWYRAEVLCYQEEEDIVYVRYVDYGLTQAITDKEKMLEIPDKYITIPGQAITCQLAGMPTPAEMGLDESDLMQILAKLVGCNKLLCSVLEQQAPYSENPTVNLYLLENGREVLITNQIVEIIRNHYEMQDCDFLEQ